jgi:glycerol-3-phosphate dehydrogenase
VATATGGHRRVTGGALALRDRDGAFAALSARQFDVLVVGGGITGAGIARDAAMRGLHTALVDAGDLAAGTSSRSTKLVHGGLRYLAQGDFAIVREAARERQAVRRIAPHLAVPTPVVVPARSRVELAKLALGLHAFDRLGAVEPGERHATWSRRRLAAQVPLLDSDGLAGAGVYPEYITDDARLVVANARSAAAHGACVVTYAAVTAFTPAVGRVDGATVRGTLAGEAREAHVRARVVVNAAGPWVDVVRRCEDAAAARRLMLTKGIHIVVRRSRLPLTQSLLTAAPDGRSVFVVPRGRCLYIGTTDTFHAQPEYWPAITGADADYLLATAAATFVPPALERADVIAAWAGLRPLLQQPGRAPSEASRRDEMVEGSRGVITIAGGKLTAYRRMAERVVDRCQERLGLRARHARTGDEPLPGGDFTGSVTSLARRLEAAGAGVDDAERLARLYGGEAAALLAAAQRATATRESESALQTPPAMSAAVEAATARVHASAAARAAASSAAAARAAGALAEAEAAHAVLQEGACTLEDWWLRRSSRGLFDDDGGLAVLPAAATRMGTLLGWSEAEGARQVEHCRALRTRNLAALRGG